MGRPAAFQMLDGRVLDFRRSGAIMDLNLRGLRTLVTGGTRGIGRAIALRFAREGANVAICARDGDAVRSTLETLEREGVRAFGRALDVADRAALADWVNETGEALGGIDVLITNASAFAMGGSPEEFRRAFDVDLMHCVNAVNAALPQLERSQAGAIVAISSISGSEDYGFEDAAYGAMKAALNFYVKSLSRELAPKHIRVNTVSPGTTYFKGGYWHKVEIENPRAFAQTMASNPMGRMATAEDIADMVVFVASPAAAFVSGANIIVDGSLTRRVQN
jgi:NAD(P)-dependent dehydrogenase (short-subunit alcohol dehydrogenase family)